MDDENIEYDGRHYIGNLLDDDGVSLPSKTESRFPQAANPPIQSFCDEMGSSPFVWQPPVSFRFPASSTYSSAMQMGPPPNQKFWPEPPPPYTPYTPRDTSYEAFSECLISNSTVPSPKSSPTALLVVPKMAIQPNKKLVGAKREDPTSPCGTALVEKAAKQQEKLASKLPSSLQPKIPGYNPIESAKNDMKTAKTAEKQKEDPKRWLVNAPSAKKKEPQACGASNNGVKYKSAFESRVRRTKKIPSARAKAEMPGDGLDAVENFRFSALKSMGGMSESSSASSTDGSQVESQIDSKCADDEKTTSLSQEAGEEKVLAEDVSPPREAKKLCRRRGAMKRQNSKDSESLVLWLCMVPLALVIGVLHIVVRAVSAIKVALPDLIELGLVKLKEMRRKLSRVTKINGSGPTHYRRKITLRPTFGVQPTRKRKS